MKIPCLLITTIILFNYSCQNDNRKEAEKTEKIRSKEAKYISDLEKYAKENNLDFMAEPEFDKSLDYHLLGQYTRPPYAIIYKKPVVALKEADKYHILNISVPFQLSNIIYINPITVSGCKMLKLVGHYETRWSMMAESINHQECYKALILLDIENNKVVFSEKFSNNNQKYENDTVVIKDQGFNYSYKISDNAIEFYKTDIENPDCYAFDCERDEIKAGKITDAKPAFYYRYDEKKKKWIKGS